MIRRNAETCVDDKGIFVHHDTTFRIWENCDWRIYSGKYLRAMINVAGVLSEYRNLFGSIFTGILYLSKRFGSRIGYQVLNVTTFPGDNKFLANRPEGYVNKVIDFDYNLSMLPE